jgi:hypothetical protein
MEKAMVEEMDALDNNEAWDIVELPVGRKFVGRKWLFKKKFNVEGKVEKYKARLVAKGYSQVEGIDFGDIFSPVAKLTSIRFLLSIVVYIDLEVEQMDVKTTFQHGDLEEEIYMKQPEGFVVKGKKELVVGIGADPGFNSTTLHQQNPNYWPFRKHLRSR